MTFLDSFFLIATAATLIPFLIHLLNRQKLRIIPFSTLRFLKELQQRTFRRVRMKQILLLIIRSLIVLLIALAFARPAFRGKISGLQSESATSLVIILDHSASMGLVDDNGVTRLEKAKRRAEQVVQMMGPDDEAGLILLGHPVQAVSEGLTNRPDRILEWIRQVSLSYEGTDWVQAVQVADDWLNKSTRPNREVYLITDGRGELGTAEPFVTKKSWSLFWLLTENAPMENAALEGIEIKNQLFEPNKPVEVHARIRADEDLNESVLAVLWLDGKRTAQSMLDFSTGQTQIARFRVIPGRTGWVSGWVELEDDRLLADNKSFFTFRIPEKVNNLIISPGETDVQYLETVLSIAGDWISFQRIGPGQIFQMDWRNVDVLWLVNTTSLNSGEWARIQNWMNLGKTAILVPGENWDLRSLNETVGKNLSLRGLGVEKVTTSGGFVSTEKVDMQHPLFQDLFEQKPVEISPVRIRQWIHYQTFLNSRSTVRNRTVIAQSDGSPFLLESRSEKGTWIFFSIAFQPGWADFIYQGLFPSLVTRLIYYGSFRTETLRSYHVGDAITIPVDPQRSGGRWFWTEPQGGKTQIQPRVLTNIVQAPLSEPKEPGIYTLHQDDKKIQLTAVNLPPEETRYTEITRESLKKVFSTLHWVKPEESLERTVKQLRYGREIWKPLVMFTLILIILEMILSRVPRADLVSEGIGNFQVGSPSSKEKVS